MIKTTGTYLLSKDGGKTYKNYGNMLVEGYYKNDGSNILNIRITSNGTPPTPQDEGVATGIGGNVSSGFTNFSLDIEQDAYKVHCSAEFNIGLGNTLVARDLNILSGNSLFSRALFKDEEGNPVDIVIDSKDDIRVKYILTYHLPREGIPVNVIVHNRSVSGTLRICNPNIWGTSVIGVPIDITMVGVAPVNTWVQDINGYIDSGVTSHTMNVQESGTFNSSEKKYTYYASADLDKLNTTFRQIAFTDGAVSPRNIAILIDLDEDIVNTPDDYLSLGIDVIQRLLP